MREKRERADWHNAIDTEVFDNQASTWDELSVAAQLDLARLYLAQLPVTHRSDTAMVDIYSDCPRLVAATAMMITGDDLLEDRERARYALLGAVGEYIAAEIKTAVWRRDSSREDRFLAAENLADDLISERRSSVCNEFTPAASIYDTGRRGRRGWAMLGKNTYRLPIDK